MVESDPLGVMLRIRLGINLAFAYLFDELGRNLNVVINQEFRYGWQMFLSCSPRGHSHRINVQVGRCTLRGWTNKRIYIVYPATFGMNLIQESKAAEMHILRVLPTIEMSWD